MVLTTYLDERQKKEYLLSSDDDINILLREARFLSAKQENWYIKEITGVRRRWFKKIKQVCYVLYFDTGADVQVINFAEGYAVGKHTILNYFYGIIGGLNRSVRKP